MKKNNESIIKKLSTLLLISLFFISCSVSWVPTYNETLETQIINGQKMTSKFYSQMLLDQVTNRTYDNYKKGYVEISTEINSIRFQVNATKNASLILASIDSLGNKWEQYQERHRARDSNHTPTSDDIIKTNTNLIDGFWKPLLIDMRALKMVRKKD